MENSELRAKLADRKDEFNLLEDKLLNASNFIQSVAEECLETLEFFTDDEEVEEVEVVEDKEKLAEKAAKADMKTSEIALQGLAMDYLPM